MLTKEKAARVLVTPAAADSKTKSGKCSAKSTSTAAQIARLIELLRRGPRDTHSLRRFGLSHPAGRVQDLLKRGYDITTARITTVDSDGFSHVGVALYSLVAEPGQARRIAQEGT